MHSYPRCFVDIAVQARSPLDVLSADGDATRGKVPRAVLGTRKQAMDRMAMLFFVLHALAKPLLTHSGQSEHFCPRPGGGGGSAVIAISEADLWRLREFQRQLETGPCNGSRRSPLHAFLLLRNLLGPTLGNWGSNPRPLAPNTKRLMELSNSV